MKCHEFTDEQWALVELIVPRAGRVTVGQRGIDEPSSTAFSGFGAPVHLGGTFGRWQTVYRHCARWRRKGLFDEII